MNKAITFMLGAAAGSLLTWKLIEQKYKRIADEEIESVREHYRNKEKQAEPNDEVNKVIVHHTGDIEVAAWHNTVIEDDNKIDYKKQIEDLGYFNEEDISIEHTDDGYEIYVQPGVESVEPFVISPEEYGEKIGYDAKCWTYYADFVLADEDDEIVTNPESIIGDALLHFGEYEDDSVCVRNENVKCDYEILKHEKTFSEINGGQN